MIGETAEYVALVSSVLSGQTWSYYVDELPLVIGLQLRNVSLAQEGIRIIPPGRTAGAKAREILGEHISSWLE